MAIIYDLLELDGLPGNGDTVGVPGSGSDIEFLTTETQAEVPDDYFSTSLMEQIEAGFHVGSNGTWPAEIDGITYSTSGLWDITYDLGGTSHDGFLVQAEPVGGGALRYFFLPEDGVDPLEINQITITSMTSTIFVDADWVDQDETVNFLVFFGEGTRVATPQGPRRVEDLAPGDMVTTLDDGDRPVLWAATTPVSQAEAARDARLRAIEIEAGALGANVPDRPLRLSRQHRVMVSSKIAARMFGENEVLVPAKDLLGVPGVRVAAAGAETRFVHLMLPGHSVLLADGVGAESLWLGREEVRMLGTEAAAEARRQLYAPQTPARPLVSGRRAKSLVARHLKNDRPLCAPARPAGQEAARRPRVRDFAPA